MRGDAIMYQGRLRTLRSVKVDVERIDAGSDCGLSFRDWERSRSGTSWRRTRSRSWRKKLVYFAFRDFEPTTTPSAPLGNFMVGI